MWVAIGLSVFIVILIGFLLKQKSQITTLRTQLGEVSQNGSPAVAVFLDTMAKLTAYTPYALNLFGFIRDIIYQELRYSVVSFTGIAAVLVNALIGLIGVKIAVSRGTLPMAGGGDEATSWFEYLDSCFSPQLLVLSSSMISFMMLDFGLARDMSQNIGLFSASGAFLALQGLFMGVDGSFNKYFYAQQGMTGSTFITWIVGILVGGALGAGGYAATLYIKPSVLPSREFANLGPNGIVVPKAMQSTGPPETIINVGEKSELEQSLPVNDQDQFVCEAYRDGELITSTIVE